MKVKFLLGWVEPACRYRIPSVRVTREPDTYVRLRLVISKDHHGGIPELRFTLRKRVKPSYREDQAAMNIMALSTSSGQTLRMRQKLWDLNYL